MENRKVTIILTDEEIDALEDFCTMKYSSKESQEKDRGLVLDVWTKIVKCVDNGNQKPNP